MNIVWGLPTQTRNVKKEKFENAVLTLNAVKEKGANRKFVFNSAAKDLLGIIPGESLITIGFSGKDVFIMSTGQVERDEEGKIVSEIPANHFVINKGLGFSDKRYFNYIVSENALSPGVDNYLHLEKVEGQPYVKVASITNDGTITEESVEKFDETHVEVAPITEEIASVVEEVEQEPEVFEAIAVEDDNWDDVLQSPQSPVVEEKPVVEETPKFKIKPAVKTPEVKAEPDTKRVKFAIDNTEEEATPTNEVPWDTNDAEEDEEW